jgi:FkbM family methyltransferase
MLAVLRQKLDSRVCSVFSSLIKRYPEAGLRLRKLATQTAPETFLENLSHVQSIVPRVQTVIDVGANRGDFTTAASTVFSPRTILAFEPNRDLHPQIRSKCSFAKIFPYALGTACGTGILYKHADPGMTSLLPINERFREHVTWESAADIKQTSVPMRPLAQFIDQGQIYEQATLLKLDTQGTELDIIISAHSKLRACCAIIVEHMFWSGYEGRSSFAETVHYLDSRCFELAMVCNMRYRRTGTPAVADFVFVPTAVQIS